MSKSGASRNGRAVFRRWLVSRPGAVRAAARTIKPWSVYRLKGTGQHCVVQAYSNDGSVRVLVIGHDDPVRDVLAALSPLSVFGISPTDLARLPSRPRDPSTGGGA